MIDNVPKIAVMGGGSWATAIAKIILRNVPQITWYMRRQEQIDEFKRIAHNPSYLSSVTFDIDRISFTNKITANINANPSATGPALNTPIIPYA